MDVARDAIWGSQPRDKMSLFEASSGGDDGGGALFFSPPPSAISRIILSLESDILVASLDVCRATVGIDADR